MSPRDALHRLIDALPERDLPKATEVLESLRETTERPESADSGVPRDLSGRRSNGLARLAGTWSAEEFAEFEAALAATEQIDEELWR